MNIEPTPSDLWARDSRADRSRELRAMLRVARDHGTCRQESARIEGDAIVVPFDTFHDDHGWSIERQTVRTRRELLDALGY